MSFVWAFIVFCCGGVGWILLVYPQGLFLWLIQLLGFARWFAGVVIGRCCICCEVLGC